MNKGVKKMLTLAVCAAMLLECNAGTVFATEVNDEVQETEEVTDAEVIPETPDLAANNQEEVGEQEEIVEEVQETGAVQDVEEVQESEEEENQVLGLLLSDGEEEYDPHEGMTLVEGLGWTYDGKSIHDLCVFDEEEVVLENNHEGYHFDWISVGNCEEKLKNTRKLIIKDFDKVWVSDNCPNLEELVIIGAKDLRGFYDCPKLKKVVLDNSLEFCRCNGFGEADIQFEDGVSFLPEEMYSNSNRNRIEIPNSIKKIGKSAFKDCRELEVINIPDSVEDIEDYAFYDCRKLNNVKLSKNLKHIGGDVFKNCRELTEITIPKSLISAGGKLLYGSSYGMSGPFGTYSMIEKATIEDGITRIPEYLFYDCWKIKDIYIPDSVEIIGRSAFQYTLLENVELPSNLLIIEGRAFDSCKNLNEILIPENVEFIGDGAFANCSRLQNIYINSKDVIFEKNPLPKATIHGYKGSTAEQYAKERKFIFIELEEETETPEETKSIGNLDFIYTDNYVYNGSEIMPAVKVLDDGKRLIRDKHYTIAYSSNVDVGNGKIIVIGIKENGYEGTKELTFNIAPYDIEKNVGKCIEVVGPISEEYSKFGVKPDVIVWFRNAYISFCTLRLGKDYTVSYKNNKTIGKNATITVTGMGNFTGSKIYPFEITERSLCKAKIVAYDRPVVPMPNDYKTTVVVRDWSKDLVPGVDYEEDIQYVYAKQTVVWVNGKQVTRKAGETVGSKDIIPGDTVIKVIITAKQGGVYRGIASTTYSLDSLCTIYQRYCK